MNKMLFAAALLGAAAFAGNAFAADVVHNQENPKGAFASSVIVPPGYTTYYVSGGTGKGGNTAEQTAATLEGLKTKLTAMGLTFGDVVSAHVFVSGDPNMGGKMDFAGMNESWFKVFGTADQPNKPARAAFQVANLANPAALVEIELIAVKKAK